MQSNGETLFECISRLGFGDLIFSPAGELSTCDLALRTACFQAFVKRVSVSESLIDSWRDWQLKIAEYARQGQNTPRDLYLVLLADQNNQTITLEDIDRISRDTLFCRKLVYLDNGTEYQSVVETWPFLSISPSAVASSRALVTVLDGFKNSGYDSDVLDIFTKWISGQQGRLKLLSSPLPPAIPELDFATYARDLPATEEPRHRLGLLSIKDFRGIRRMEIDLSADLVLIHGRNGTGKTSLFDALEWVFLGEVEHLSDVPNDGDQRIPFVNIFSDDGAAHVSLQLLSPEGTTTLERSIGLKQNQALRYRNRSFGDDRTALIEVLGDQARDLNVGSLRDLVRSTSFLAQATLRRFFSKTPGERYAAVSHLLGTQDYEKFLKKLSGIRSEFSKERSANLLIEEELQASLTAKRADLERLNNQLVNSPAGAELDTRLKRVLERIVLLLKASHSEIATISINEPYLFEEIQAFLDVSGEWRRVSETSLQARLQNLASIETSAQQLQEQEHQAAALRSDITQIESQSGKVATDLQRLEKDRRSNEEAIAEANGALQAMSSIVTLLQRLAITVEREQQLRQVVAVADQQVAALIKQEEDKRSEREQIQPGLDAHSSTRATLSTESESLHQQLRILSELKGRSSEVARYRAEMEEIQTEVRASESIVASKQSELEREDLSYATMFAAIQSSITSLESAKVNSERYRSLLSSFREFVHNPNCPLCGQSYSSAEELSRRIDATLEGEPAELRRAETDLNSSRQRLKVVVANQDQLRSDLARAASSIRSGRTRLNEIVAQLGALEDLAGRVNLPIEVIGTGGIDERMGICESRIGSLSRELGEAESDYVRQTGELSRLDSQLRFISDQRQAASASLNRELQDLSNVVNTRTDLMRSASLDDIGQLSKRIEETLATVSSNTSLLTKLEHDRSMLQAEIRTSESTSGSLRKQRDDLEQRLRALSISMDQLKSKTAVLGQYDPLGLKLERERATVSFSQLKELEAEITRARELAAWLLARREAGALLEDTTGLASELDTLTESSKRDARWEDHLNALEASIKKARYEAENWQLTHYGPAISNLYKRFSAHPIFGRIEVSVDPVKEEIRITADVNDLLLPHLKHPRGKLAPLQYFSEAQANVLALSVFLSNAFQQRWSKMNSVFMDDPVQNMDDLNSNAFIDTMRALTASSGRQFVVATCDLQLYKLMLVKLSCLNTKAHKKFSAFRLEGMSIEGPRVVKDV